MYLAPSHFMMQANSGNDDVPTQDDGIDEESPIVIPQNHQEEYAPVAPLLRQEESTTSTTTDVNKINTPSLRIHVCSLIKSIFQGVIDLFLVIAVILMSFLDYDVDVCIVKGDEEPLIEEEDTVRGPSGRVIVRNGEQDDQSLRARMVGANLV